MPQTETVETESKSNTKPKKSDQQMRIVERVFRLSITFLTPTLATLPANRSILGDFIHSKGSTDAQASEEMAAMEHVDLDDEANKMKTIFPRDEEGFVHAWDYQWRGFLKDKVDSLVKLGMVKHLSPWTYKAHIDKFVFVDERRIYFLKNGERITEDPLPLLERPVRATTQKGDRISLRASEKLEGGITCVFNIVLLGGSRTAKKSGDSHRAGLNEEELGLCFDLGKRNGFSQWHGGGHGSFEYTLTEIE